MTRSIPPERQDVIRMLDMWCYEAEYLYEISAASWQSKHKKEDLHLPFIQGYELNEFEWHSEPVIDIVARVYLADGKPQDYAIRFVSEAESSRPDTAASLNLLSKKREPFLFLPSSVRLL